MAAVSWLVVAAAVVAVSVDVGVPALHAVSYLLVWLASTTVPGVLVWRACAAPASVAEDLGFGNAIGIALLVLAWVPAVVVGDASLAWWWPVTVVVVFVTVPSLRSCWRPRRDQVNATPSIWHPAAASVCLATVGYLYVTVLRGRPLPGTADTRIHPDMWFQQSLVNQLEHTLVVMQPQVAGVPKRYHWFANADVAATAQMSGVPSTSVAFILWFVALAVTMALVAMAFARRLMGDDGTEGRRWWVGPVGALFAAAAPFVLVLGEPRQPSITTGFMTVSLSGVLGLVMVLAVSGAMIEVLRGRGGRGIWALVLLLMAMSVGTKPSNLPIAIAALCLVALVQYRRTRRVPVAPVVLAVVGIALIGVSTFHLMGGSAGSGVVPFDTLGLDPAVGLATDDKYVVALNAVTAFLVFVGTQIPRLLGLSGIAYRRTRADIGIWWSAGVVFAGWCASWLVQQSGYSQRYFWRVVIVLAVMTSVVVAVRVLVPLRPRAVLWPLLTAGILGVAVSVWVLQWPEADVDNLETGWLERLLPYALAGIVFGACAVAWRLVARKRSEPVIPLMPLALVFVLAAGTPVVVDDLRTPIEYAVAGETLPDSERELPRLVTEAEQDAGLWLREHADDGNVVTNVYCVPTRYVQGCDATGFWVGGLSARPVVMGGWAYTEKGRDDTDRGGVSYKERPSPYPDRLQLSLDMIRDPDASVIRTLQSEYGAEWIFAAHRATPVSPRISQYAERVYRNGDVSIYRLH